MENKDLLLSIDNGTQSLKALIFDLKGELIAKDRLYLSPTTLKIPDGLSRTLMSSGRHCARHARAYGNRGTTRNVLPAYQSPHREAR